MSEFTKKLRSIREHIWTNKPQEIAGILDKSKGYNDTWGSRFFPTLYSWEETVAARNVLVVLRKALRAGELDLGTARSLVRSFLELYVSYLKMTNLSETTQLLREAAAEAPTMASREELLELLEELIRYIGRMHYWIEPVMPWEQIIQAFEKATR